MTPEQCYKVKMEALRRCAVLQLRLPREIEIVFVISRSMEMKLNLNGELRGVRVIVAPPNITFDLLRPAVFGKRFCDGMELGDLVVCEDGSVYMLESVEIHQGANTIARFVEVGGDKAAEAATDLTWRKEYMAIWGSEATEHIRHMEKSEDELSAGDTKLLDDFLHSFMQPGAKPEQLVPGGFEPWVFHTRER